MPKIFETYVVKKVIVQAGDGDRDISYNDSFDVSEQLAGTLGPVQTQDSVDVDDEFVARELVLQDSMLPLDDLGEISGLVLADSVDVFDQLAGTLGPVRAPDTFDATDDPVFGPLVLQEIFNTSVASDVTLSAQSVDSFDIAARLGQVTRFDDEQFFVGDRYGSQSTQVDDSVVLADSFDADAVRFADSLDVAVLAQATITAANEESFDIVDRLMIGGAVLPDSLAVVDQRGDANVTNARLWPNTVVSNTGFTDPNNLIDLSETTAANISARQSGGLLGGSSATVNGNIQVSAPDIAFSPDATTSSVQVQAGWTTTSSGGLQNGNSVNVAIEYSLNNGGSWTLLERVTNDSGTGNPTANITASTAQLNQLRFRAVGSVVSGTTLLTGGANQTFQFRYARVQFNAVQVL